MAELSVIIPVYNAEAFLSKCLDSVCSQTLADLEIICVNDCSTDRSIEILESYRQKDDRIKIIALDRNSGPGAARNRGIIEASGEYLGFVDSDDWIDSDYFESMLSVIKTCDSDMLLNNHILQETPKSSLLLEQLGAPKVSEAGEFIKKEIAAIYSIPALYLHIYRKQFLIENNCFCPVKYNIGEDKFFNIVACMRANGIYCYYGPAYHYRKVQTGITKDCQYYNLDALRYFEDVKKYFKDEIYESSFCLKLYNYDLFGHITMDEQFFAVKKYMLELSDYFNKSGVWLSDFDRYVIDAVLQSNDSSEYMKYVGREPWLRYQTIERIKHNKKVKISVIVPIYNTEKYIEPCLRSICDQTYRDIEIICADDASTDGSLSILKRFACEDNRIKIIELKENRGQANARNVALEAAKGEYIYFIDSDDWIDKDYLETMISVMESQECPIIVNSNFIREYQNPDRSEESSYPFIPNEGKVYDASELQVKYPPVVWSRLVRKSLLDELNFKFLEIRYAEDIFFVYSIELYAGKVFAFKGKSAYHYRQRPSSSVHNAARGYNYFESFRHFYLFSREHNISTKGVKLFYVEALTIDSKEQYNYINNYLNEIKDEINANLDLYNEQEKFLVEIMNSTIDYEDFKAHYNPNIALSFIRYRMTHK